MINLRGLALIAMLFLVGISSSACLPTATDIVNALIGETPDPDDNGGGGGGGGGPAPDPSGGGGGPAPDPSGGGGDPARLSMFTDDTFPDLLTPTTPPTGNVNISAEEEGVQMNEGLVRFTQEDIRYVPTTQTDFSNQLDENEIEHLPDYEGFNVVRSSVNVDGRTDPVSYIGFFHNASSSVAILDSVGGLAVGGADFQPTPTGQFIYTGMNILRYLGSEQSLGEVQDGTFVMSVNFENQTGQIVGKAVDTTSGVDREGVREYLSNSSITGNIWLNNVTGTFKTPDEEYLIVEVTETKRCFSTESCWITYY